MTDAEIDTLTLEQLRVQVAVRVMGIFNEMIPDYPRDNTAAIEVLKKIMGALGAQIILLPDGTAGVSLAFSPPLTSFRNIKADGPTFAIAACRAALKAVERKHTG